MAYTPVSFVYGEVLTAAKMNILAANDASFHDGSGLPEISVLDKAYPVGSIFMSATLSTATTVATALGGGTWQAWGQGRVPVGVDSTQTEFDTAEETGGEKTHILTVNEMPSHNHGSVNNRQFLEDTGFNDSDFGWHSGDSGYRASPAVMSSTGGGQAHNNLQPYITCYFWKRTA